MEEELKQILEDINSKLDEISKTNEGIEDNKIEKVKERIADLKDYLEDTRKGLIETKMDIENKIVKNPITFLISAFVGGLIIGHFTKKN